MSKWIELQGTIVANITVPNITETGDTYKSMRIAQNDITEFRTEDDSLQVEIGWNYDPETHSYSP